MEIGVCVCLCVCVCVCVYVMVVWLEIETWVIGKDSSKMGDRKKLGWVGEEVWELLSSGALECVWV
jgi:hypothetical protein